MPYKLKEVGKGLFKVVNKKTGKAHSIYGLPKDVATAQMRLLYGLEHGMKPRK